MRRSVLRFSVRTWATLPLDEMRVRIEAALGCRFRDGDYQKVPALVTTLLGMRVGLLEWLSVGDREVFRLQSYIDDARLVSGPGGEPVEIATIDISDAIIHLLDKSGAGQWRIPAREEIQAERDHGDALLRRYRMHDYQA